MNAAEPHATRRQQVSVQLPTPAVNVALPASAATELRAAAQCFCSAGRAAIKRYLLPAAPTAANPPHAAAAGEQDSANNYSTEQVSRDYTYTAAQSNAGVKPKKRFATRPHRRANRLFNRIRQLATMCVPM